MKDVRENISTKEITKQSKKVIEKIIFLVLNIVSPLKNKTTVKAIKKNIR